MLVSKRLFFSISALFLWEGQVFGSSEEKAPLPLDVTLAKGNQASDFEKISGKFRKPFKLWMENTPVPLHQKLLLELIAKTESIEAILKGKNVQSKIILDAVESFFADAKKEKLEYILDGAQLFRGDYRSILAGKNFLKNNDEEKSIKEVRSKYRELLSVMRELQTMTSIEPTDLARIQAKIRAAIVFAKAPSRLPASPSPTALLLGLQFDDHVVFERRSGEKYVFFISDGRNMRLKRLMQKLEKRMLYGDKDTSSSPTSAAPPPVSNKQKPTKKKTTASAKKEAFDQSIKGMSISGILEAMQKEKDDNRSLFDGLHQPKTLDDHATSIAESSDARLTVIKSTIKHLKKMSLKDSPGHYILMGKGTKIVSDHRMRDFVESIGFKPKGATAIQQYGTLAIRSGNAASLPFSCTLNVAKLGQGACGQWLDVQQRIKSCPLSNIAMCPDKTDKGIRYRNYLNETLSKMIEADTSDAENNTLVTKYKSEWEGSGKKDSLKRSPILEFEQYRENLHWFFILTESFYRENPPSAVAAPVESKSTTKKKKK